MAKRIQRKRTRGWRMPEGAIYVGRPTKFGNPFIVGSECASSNRVGTYELTAQEAVEVYGLWVNRIASNGERDVIARFGLLPVDLTDIVKELRGHDLACWCPLDQPCHADVLLELANGTSGPSGPSGST